MQVNFAELFDWQKNKGGKILQFHLPFFTYNKN